MSEHIANELNKCNSRRVSMSLYAFMLLFKSEIWNLNTFLFYYMNFKAD